VKIAFSFKFFTAFISFLIAIVLIALFIETGFIRNHFGDVLIVLLIWCFIRIFLRGQIKLLWLYIFAFATMVEFAQYFGLVYILGLGHSQLARVIIGTTFDWWDIVMYFVGCAIIWYFERKFKF